MGKILSVLLVATIFGLGFLTGGEWEKFHTPPLETAPTEIAAYREPIRINTLPINVNSDIYLPADEENIVKNIDEIVYWYEKVSPPKIKPFVRGEQYGALTINVPAEEQTDAYVCHEVEKLAQSDRYNDPGVLLVLVQGPSTCDYNGLAQIEGNWLISYGWSPGAGNPFPQGVILHELGHILGLPHAQSYECEIMGFKKRKTMVEDCEKNEYGDNTDPMGNSSTVTPLGFNPHSLRFLNWGIDTNYTEYYIPGTYQITLYNDHKQGDKTIVLPGNYLLSLRMIPQELRNLSFSERTDRKEIEGIYLYRIIPGGEGRKDTSVVVPFASNRQHGTPGDHYLNTVHNFSFIINNINPHRKTANVTLRIAKKQKIRSSRGETVTDVWGPNIVLDKLGKSHDGYSYALYPIDYSGIREIIVVDKGKRETYKSAKVELLYFGRLKQPRTVSITVTDKVGNSSTETLEIRSKALSAIGNKDRKPYER